MEDINGLTSAESWIDNVKKNCTDNPELVLSIIGSYENVSAIQLTHNAIQQFATDNNISLCFTMSIQDRDSVINNLNQIVQATIDQYQVFKSL